MFEFLVCSLFSLLIMNLQTQITVVFIERFLFSYCFVSVGSTVRHGGYVQILFRGFCLKSPLPKCSFSHLVQPKYARESLHNLLLAG